MERLSLIAKQAGTGTVAADHPLDPLGPAELAQAAAIIREHFASKHISFNTISLLEPTRAQLKAGGLVPRRAKFVVIEKGVNGLVEGVCDLDSNKVLQSEARTGVQPILTVEDLNASEAVIRVNPRVIEQCEISGIGAHEMHMVYCDPWTIGYDERWGTGRRLQQCLLYFRSHENDSQYSHPLDFCPIVDTETKEVVFLDIPAIRRPVRRSLPHSNFYPADIIKDGTKMREIKPITITQPEGVNFTLTGRIMEWQNFRFHIGFNYREGIVLSDISYNDQGNVRPLFHRISLAEMVVPYGNPDHPHQRKHAFDLGEYGAGYMTNSLALGCDCKGSIHYLDGHFVDRKGDAITVKNAICIHEEDDGVLFKHSDFRDSFSTSIVTRGTKLIVSQIFTAANYEYMVYWIFHQDGTIQLEIKLTGILNTYVMNPGEDTRGFGTQVYPGVNAHNHQHLFSLRIHPTIDGDSNSVAMVDAVASDLHVGHPDNKYGNAFSPKRTVLKTVAESRTHYEGSTSRTWDFFNPAKINPYSGKPVSYKLVSRECPRLLPKEGSLVWKRAPFARYNFQAVPYAQDKFYPAGEHVPQTSGEYGTGAGIDMWTQDSDSVENTDIVCYHTFGLTHFPAPEDFPLMPAEPMTLLLRPRNFFTRNPALDVPPSYAMTTSEAKKKSSDYEIKSFNDKASTLAFSSTSGGTCCQNK